MRLTAFQSECERQLLKTLEELRWQVIDRQVEGINETYIRIQVQQPAINLFIYDDEAGIQGDGVDIRLEQPDYRGTDELIAGFMRGIRELDAT